MAGVHGQGQLGIEYRIELAPGVTADAAVQCGHPCVTGTRVTTDTLADLHRQGVSIAELADDYELTLRQVRQALAYESSR